MSAPPLPPALELIGSRAFSLYPPILNVRHNEWSYVRSTWSEIVVLNTKSEEEIWIPRRFVGELSRVDEPVMILGLNKELEYSGGQVWPHVRRVIEMPRVAGEIVTPDGASKDVPLPPPPEWSGSGTEGRIGKLIIGAMAIGLVLCIAVIGFFRTARDGSQIAFAPVLQSDLNLTANDEYVDVVRKLGRPDDDHWKSETGAMQYRILRYRTRNLAVILMGEDREKARYIGSVGADWKPVHSVRVAGGKDSSSMLRSLGKF